MSEKKAQVKKQHFVPQFYLRNFSNNKKSIASILLKSGKLIKHAPIKDQASKDYFYSDDMEIENRLSKLESNASIIIRELITSTYIETSRERIESLLFFTVLQLGRTKAAADEYLKANRDSIEAIYRHYRAKNIDESALLKLKNLEEESLDILKKPARYTMLMSMKAYLKGYFRNLQYKFLINTTCKPFITSDNPACLYNQVREKIKSINYAIATQGIQIYLPLSSNLSIIFYDPKCYTIGFKKKNFVKITNPRDIIELNKLVACNAESAIYFSLASAATILSDNYHHYHNKYKVTEQSVFSFSELSDSGVLMMSSKISMYCNLHLSFVKIRAQYRANTQRTNAPYDRMLRLSPAESEKHLANIKKAIHAKFPPNIADKLYNTLYG